MNYRIKEMQIEAGIYTNLNNPEYFEKDVNKWVDCFAEKFAELIVRECLEVGVKSGILDNDWNYPRYAKAIKEHFGMSDDNV